MGGRRGKRVVEEPSQTVLDERGSHFVGQRTLLGWLR